MLDFNIGIPRVGSKYEPIKERTENLLQSWTFTPGMVELERVRDLLSMTSPAMATSRVCWTVHIHKGDLLTVLLFVYIETILKAKLRPQ